MSTIAVDIELTVGINPLITLADMRTSLQGVIDQLNKDNYTIKVFGDFSEIEKQAGRIREILKAGATGIPSTIEATSNKGSGEKTVKDASKVTVSFREMETAVDEILKNIRTNIETTFDLSTVDLHADTLKTQLQELVDLASKIPNSTPGGNPPAGGGGNPGGGPGGNPGAADVQKAKQTVEAYTDLVRASEQVYESGKKVEEETRRETTANSILTGTIKTVTNAKGQQRQTVKITEDNAAATRQASGAQELYNSAVFNAEDALKRYARAQTSSKTINREAYEGISEQRQEIERLWQEYKKDHNLQKFREGVNAANRQVKSHTKTLNENGEKVNTLGDKLKGIVTHYISLQRAVSLVVRAMREMIGASMELDKALTQMQIVTGASDAEMKRFADDAFETANRAASNVTDIIGGATTYARLGFDAQTSSALAEYTAMLQNVGDINAQDAQDAITAIIKAFDGVDEANIKEKLDELVVVGNNFPISVSQVAEGMNNASSALAAAGNSYEKSVALLTAANTTMQNASKASTGLRTITARLRNTKTELDDLGEAMTESQYDEVVQALTDMNVRLIDVNGDYRDTYDIFKDIAAQWDKMSSTDQAALATKLSGTRMQAVFYSLVQNFGEAEKAMEAMGNAEGKLAEKNEVYANSIEGRMNQFRNEFKKLATEIFTSDWIKEAVTIAEDFLRFLAGIARAITGVVQALGGLKNTIIAITVVAGGIKIVKLTSRIATVVSAIKAATIASKEFTVAQKVMSVATGKVVESAAAARATLISFAAAAAGIALTVGISAIVNRINKQKQAAEDARRAHEEEQKAWVASMGSALSSVASEIEEVTGKIQTLTAELESTRNKIDEINSAGHISVVERDELSRLNQLNTQLSYELRVAKELEEITRKKAGRAVVDLLGMSGLPSDDGKTRSPAATYLIDKYGELFPKQVGLFDDIVSDGGKLIPQATSLLGLYQNIISAYEGSRSLGRDISEDYSFIYQIILDLQEIHDSAEWVPVPTSKDDRDINRYIEALEIMQDRLFGLVGENSDHYIGFEMLASRYGFSSLEEYTNALSSDFIRVRENAEAFRGALTQLFRTEPEAARLESLFRKMAESRREQDSIRIGEFPIDSVKSAKSALSLLDKAEQDMNQTGRLSAETIAALSEATDDYLKYIYEENGALKLNTDAWRENATAGIEGRISTARRVVAALMSENEALQEVAARYNELTNGNLDYAKRPVVSPAQITGAGWEWNGDENGYATTYSTYATIGKGKYTYTVDVTPILEDGTVLSPEALDEYVSGLITTGGKAALLESDHLNLIINVDEGDYDEAYWQRYQDRLQEIKDEHIQIWLDDSKIQDAYSDLLKLEALLRTVDSTSDTLGGKLNYISGVEAGLDALDKLYTNVLSGKNVSLDSIISSDFVNMFARFTDEYNALLDVLSKTPNDAGRVKDAINRLATAWLTQTDYLKNADDASKDYVIQLLSERGVLNANMIVTYAMEQANRDLLQSKVDLNLTKIETSEDMANLIALATQADATSASIQALRAAEAAAKEDVNLEHLTANYGEGLASRFPNGIPVLPEMGVGTDIEFSAREWLRNVDFSTIQTPEDMKHLIQQATYAKVSQEVINALTDIASQAWGEAVSAAVGENYQKWVDYYLPDGISYNERDPLSGLADFFGGPEWQSYLDSLDSGGGSVTNSSSKAKTWFDAQYAEHKHLVAMNQETDEDYFNWLEQAYQQAYAEGIISLEDYWKYEEEVYKGRKSWFEKQLAEHKHRVAMEQETDREYYEWFIDANERAYKEGIISQDEYFKNLEDGLNQSKSLFKDFLNDISKETEFRKDYDGQAKNIISLNNKAIAAIDKKIAEARARGLDNNSDYIQELISERRKYEKENKDIEDSIVDNAKNAVDKLVDLRTKMLDQEISDKRDALNKELDDLRDFYDKQRKMLQDAYDEEDYLEEQAEKRKSVSDLEEELARLRYDDSAWAQKRRAEISQELADRRKDLSDFERDHARDAAMDLLDEQQEKQEDRINSEIEGLENLRKSAKEIRDEVIEDIKKGNLSLYEDLIAWNREYGDGIDDTITEAWEGTYEALWEYTQLFNKAFNGINLTNATGWVPNLMPKGTGYASGTYYATPGLHQIDELGSETYFSPSTGGKYKMFSGGEKVLNAKASDFLYRFANGGSEMLKRFIASVGGGVLNDRVSPLMTNNEIVMGDVVIQGNADRATISEIRRAQRESVEFMLKEFGKLNR